MDDLATNLIALFPFTSLIPPANLPNSLDTEGCQVIGSNCNNLSMFNLSPFSDIRGKGSFKEGVKTGDWEEYYTSAEGSLEKKQSGTYQFGKKTGLWSLYAKNGRRVAEGTYINDQKEGEWTEGQDIDFGSRFFGKGTYKNNLKNGEWSYVAPRQNPTINGFFTNGNPSGKWVVIYNKKKYEDSLENLLKLVPKLKEFSF